jgi:hypothetical protein
MLFDKQTEKAASYTYLHNDLRDISPGKEIGLTNLMFHNSQFAYEYFLDDQMFDIVERIHKDDILNPNLDKKDELMKLDVESFVIFEYEFR